MLKIKTNNGTARKKLQPSVHEKIVQINKPYRRHDKRMDHYLLLREVDFVNQVLGYTMQFTFPGSQRLWLGTFYG